MMMTGAMLHAPTNDLFNGGTSGLRTYPRRGMASSLTRLLISPRSLDVHAVPSRR